MEATLFAFFLGFLALMFLIMVGSALYHNPIFIPIIIAPFVVAKVAQLYARRQP